MGREDEVGEGEGEGSEMLGEDVVGVRRRGEGGRLEDVETEVYD